jgi:hypothetical protein
MPILIGLLFVLIGLGIRNVASHFTPTTTWLAG